MKIAPKMLKSRRINLSSFIERYRKEDIYAVTVLPDPMRAEVQVMWYKNKVETP